ncbi:MAG: extracellular solute-binding protein [Oscillospiraceae bacterium]|nr:extracellular solute-binding protein [Oscillospiraceae bacterium]
MRNKGKLICALLLACALCACGGAAQDGAAGESGAVSPARTDGTQPQFDAGDAAPVDPSVDQTTLVVYSPHDAEPMNACIVAFMKKYPSIKVKLIAGGTGELCERIAAEADAPQADVFWGGGADSMEAYAQYFEPYVCANDAYIDEKFKDPQDMWIGESPLPMVIIYNKKLLAEQGIAAPSSWQDCLDPAFRGKIAYCQPSKSGSAYTQLCTMILANGGGEAGWAFVEKFADNLDGKILDSSGKCHKLVASGEYLIGITIEKSAVLYLGDPNVGFCYPADGTSAVADAVAIVKGCAHEENARTFVDFVTSYASQSEQSADWSRRPSRSDVPVADGLVDISALKLVDYDFAWAAGEKEENLARFAALLGN